MSVPLQEVNEEDGEDGEEGEERTVCVKERGIGVSHPFGTLRDCPHRPLCPPVKPGGYAPYERH